ncbi:LysR family transcriptional regulator ArgP [Flavisphingomonas formosensis]|uniref:LysR family transcriptional regulator ArgP n=1 Tax=Flavisphingomonas formosensis TaxID=861534 RepID=UPI0012FA937F|nr:LysR family transcriptional regulator ArgP [Sphingomonas formosensis]
MLDYPALAAVTAILREGSFERAATALGVTPSAVSQRVRALEERLGAVLIVRGHPCAPTAIGAQLCAHVEHVALLESELAARLPELAGAHGASATTIRIAVNGDSLTSWFPPAAAAFAEETGALLDLVLDDEKLTAERLRSGDVFAAITADASPVQGCRILALGSLRYVAAASPDFARRHFAEGVTAETLTHAPVLRFDRNDILQSQWVRGSLGIELAAPIHWIPSTQGFLDMAIAGLGWGLHPLVIAQPHLDAGRLVELMPGKQVDMPLYWQYSRLGAKLLERLSATVSRVARQTLVKGG